MLALSAPIVGHLEETKPFARASKAFYQPGAGPVDEKSSSSLSEMIIQQFQTTGPRQLAVYFRKLQYTAYRQLTCQVIWHNNTAVLGAQLAGNLLLELC